MMKKLKDLYKVNELDTYFLGGAVTYSMDKMEPDLRIDDREILDRICKEEGLYIIGDGWRKIEKSEATIMMHQMLRFDLAFLNSEVLSTEKVEHLISLLLRELDNNSRRFYTNWGNNPWEGNGKGGWNSLTDSTLDMSIAIGDSEKWVLFFKVGED
ncbi:hypothetical protein [uncultured Roseivirga sp.]|uniref:hypothetical protein n=1 Tax=uncultured Roseivirga sp. TaxID=543088 RepID=UPI000D7A9066|nr:hypothetical protein [uncultured Roseivirga sp.]PWL27594.1 MAG: hypothetical protein DCO95_17515 [Roseivirga sp. XM-24bin3]